MNRSRTKKIAQKTLTPQDSKQKMNKKREAQAYDNDEEVITSF